MPDDLERLQGTWSIAKLEVEGQETPDAMLADASITIKGNRFTSTGMGAVYKGTLMLDSSAHPSRLDMKFDTGPEKGNTNLGIYKLSGHTWKLCLATRGTVRPSRFASTPGSGFALETLVRGNSEPVAKPKAAAQPVPSPDARATEFEGEWQMVSAVMNGAPMEESAVQWVRRITRGNETTVQAGPQTMMKFQFTHDASKSPGTIDYVNTGGANKGKAQAGIYEFDGGLLRVCVAAPGAARPKKFESKSGDGATFTVWKRI
jgi:uncharacterized protein (TIGR03067 family)